MNLCGHEGRHGGLPLRTGREGRMAIRAYRVVVVGIWRGDEPARLGMRTDPKGFGNP